MGVCPTYDCHHFSSQTQQSNLISSSTENGRGYQMAFLHLLHNTHAGTSLSSICTLSYVNKSVIPPPVHGQPGHIHFSYLFSSRTSIHQSVLLNPLSSVCWLFPFDDKPYSRMFHCLNIFSKPSLLLHNYYFRPSLSSSSPFHQGILHLRQQNSL